MASIPKKVSERLSKQLVLFQRVLSDAKNRDVNESDTVMIITDMLAALFGFDKYTEVTSEQAIRGTYCDLAVKIGGEIKYLIEVKAIGLTLKENHLRQALNYGANQGIPWVVLTNGVDWEIYRIKFEQPIGHEHICSIDILELSPRKADDLELLYLLCKDGLSKDAISEFHKHAQNVNRFVIAALIQSEPVLNVLRREIRRLAPDSKVSLDEIGALLPDVLKRDAIEGESADQAKKHISKLYAKAQRKAKAKQAAPPADKGKASETAAQAPVAALQVVGTGQTNSTS